VLPLTSGFGSDDPFALPAPSTGIASSGRIAFPPKILELRQVALIVFWFFCGAVFAFNYGRGFDIRT
jgi:hypothetical protein